MEIHCKNILSELKFYLPQQLFGQATVFAHLDPSYILWDWAKICVPFPSVHALLLSPRFMDQQSRNPRRGMRKVCGSRAKAGPLGDQQQLDGSSDVPLVIIKQELTKEQCCQITEIDLKNGRQRQEF